MKTTVTLNLHGLRRFRETLEADLRHGGNGPIRDALHEWAVLLARFLTRRWYEGDNWKALKPATVARKLKQGLLPYILRATDQMFQAFAPELARKPGRVTQDVPFGVRVGFGGGMRYPHSTAKMSIAQLAMIHQLGLGNVPVRKIIVPPDAATRAKMRDVMQAACLRVARGEAA